ncbi:unnamed protein product [Caenorhabditis angaria]|uniref:SGF29 C-terminal domain-containing protein n=1 Tax=Caenorhabditis angaria TaxID=860376 RepID=A0A9P1ISH0_9PELO|nr:unnamed protein product [Caenorhabditis angaria]
MPRKKSLDLKHLDEQKKAALSDIHDKLYDVKEKQDQVNEALEKIQGFLNRDPHIATNQKARNRSISLHSTLLKNTENQVDLLKSVLNSIEELRKSEYKSKMKKEIKRRDLMELIQQQGETLPLWVNVNNGYPGEGVGAIASNEKLVVGDAVAAYHKDNWILAEVVTCHSLSRFECRDVDDEQKKLSVFSKTNLILLPKWRANPGYDKHALFPVDAIVLALYPQTTCFYKGVVHEVPAEATDCYQIAFDDASYPSGYSPPMSIPQKYVVRFQISDDERRKKENSE